MAHEDVDTVSFKTDRNFYDDEHFPYGFDRSGEFTLNQAQLLTKHGHAYKALAFSEREPVTEVEREFVDFCRSRKKAESIHEKTWKRYTDNCNTSSIYHSVALSRQSDYVDDYPLDTD